MNEIRLIFHREDAVTASYLYYFFQLCGVICSKRILNMEEKWQDSSLKKDSRITILLEKNNDEKSTEQSAVSAPHLLEFSPDNIFIEDGNKTTLQTKLVNVVKHIIKLNKNTEVDTDLIQLAKLYVKYDLWNLLWVYHEVPWQKDLDKGQILSSYSSLKKAIQESRQLQGIHGKYAAVFLEFIKVDLGRRQQWQEERICTHLFTKSYELVETDSGFWSAHLLCGKICELGNTYEKLASIYYRRAALLSQNSDLLYWAGKKMEHENLSERQYLDYYKRAYEKDHKNYKALYKLAYKFERGGGYGTAIDCYSSIVDDLKNGEKKSYTDIFEYVYFFKTLRRLARIYGQRSSSSEICRRYIEKSIEVRENVRNDAYIKYMCTNKLISMTELISYTNEWLKQLTKV